MRSLSVGILCAGIALCAAGHLASRALAEPSLPQRAEDTEPLAPGVRVPPVTVRTIEGEEIFLESRLTATASGRPSIAT